MELSMNGHSGVSNEQVNEAAVGNFSFVLTFLNDTRGGGHFVMHATSNLLYGAGLHPLEFLKRIGLTHFRGQCPFHYDGCHFGSIARKEPSSGMPDIWGTQQIHEGFKRFCSRIDELYNVVRKEAEILSDIAFQAELPRVFGNPGVLEIDETAIPAWVEEHKFEKLCHLEVELREKHTAVNELRELLPLLYGTGDELENAVIAGLRVLSIQGRQTERGFTADILASTEDQSRNFAFEVTGIAGQVKKDSNKPTQVLQFEMQKENDEKTILLASTYNKTPIAERPAENFTPQVVDFLGKFPILLMTGLDLYRMVIDVFDGKKQPNVLAELLHASTGLLKYPPE